MWRRPVGSPSITPKAASAISTGIGELKRTITGEGTFYGSDAYAQYQRLQELLEDETPGNLEHPLWGIRYCYFTGLELTQEPKENVVDYKFTFTQALTNGIVPK